MRMNHCAALMYSKQIVALYIITDVNVSLLPYEHRASKFNQKNARLCLHERNKLKPTHLYQLDVECLQIFIMETD